MGAICRQLPKVVLTLWVGGLWAMGLLIAPALFRILPDRALAGAVAGRLFTVVAATGLACGIFLCASALVRFGRSSLRSPRYLVILAMIALTAVGEFGLQPILAGLKHQAAPLDVMQSALRGQFTAWHGVASGLYLVNCALGWVAVVLPDGVGRTIP